MVRVLASLIVVCLVAATGVRPAAVAPEQRSTLKVARAGERLHARVVEGAPGRVVSQTSGAGRLLRAPGAGPELAAIAPASRVGLAPSNARITGPSAREPLVVVFRPISTRSARGPPVV